MAITVAPLGTNVVNDVDFRRMTELAIPPAVLLGGSYADAVQSNPFAATPGTGRAVNVATGSAHIGGLHRVDSDAVGVVPITANASGQGRTDLIVLRLDLATPSSAFVAIAGTPAGTPSPPNPTNTAQVYDLPLVEVDVASGATSFATADLRDRRPKGLTASRQGRGVLAYRTITTAPAAGPDNSTGTVAHYISALTATVNQPAGRLLRASASLLVAADGIPGAAPLQVQILIGKDTAPGADAWAFGQQPFREVGNAGQKTLNLTAPVPATGRGQTFSVGIVVVGATQTIHYGAGSTYPGWLLVEDISG